MADQKSKKPVFPAEKVVLSDQEKQRILKQLEDARATFAEKYALGWKESDWKFISDKNGFSIHFQDGAKGMPNIYRTSGVLKGHPSSDLNLLYRRSSLTLQWDKHVDYHHFVADLDTSGAKRLLYLSSPGIALVSPRDYLLASEWSQPRDGVWLETSISATHQHVPNRSGYVRAHMYISFVIMETLNSDAGVSTRLTSVVQTDIKGWIPHSVIHAATPNAFVDNFNSLSAFVTKVPPPYTSAE